MIKAIVFDFFGVVCSDQYWKYVRRDRQGDNEFSGYAEEVNLGDISWQAFVAKVAEATKTSVAEVDKLYESERIDPRVIGLIHELKKNYKIGLLTNAHHEFIDELLAKNYLSTLFDAVVVSSRVGVVKPNPAIFEIMLEQLGLEPEEVVYLDDLERHVGSAAELGIRSMLYKDFDQAKGELEQLLHAD